MTRYYCHNEECVIETYNAPEDKNGCPCCGISPQITAQEYETELAIAMADAEYHKELYGCPYEDMESMYYQPQVVTNDDGEPIGWG